MKRGFWLACLLALLLVPLCAANAEAADASALSDGTDLRIMSYNVLQYPAPGLEPCSHTGP